MEKLNLEIIEKWLKLTLWKMSNKNLLELKIIKDRICEDLILINRIVQEELIKY